MSSSHLQVGITGGIGSGKSLVCKIFTILNLPVYDADKRAKELMNKDTILKNQIIGLFGKDAFDSNGQLNRKLIAKRVFENKKDLVRLNSFVHPRVADDYRKWRDSQPSPIVIEEAALLFETGIAEQLDFLIVITAPEELRISRVMKRDKRNEEQIRAIMSNQWPEARKAELADLVIKNDNSTPVIPQVLKVWEMLKEKANLK